MRVVPGLSLIAQLQTIVPVLLALKEWSRETSPEVVDEHFARVGLSRDLLDQDLATAQEAMAYARDLASERASRVADRAATVAGQARETARSWLHERTKPRDTSES